MTSLPPLYLPANRMRGQKGSMLIVAMLLSAVIALSLTSYLALSRNSLKLANRSLYNNAAMNLAENGLEEAMYSINRKIADPSYSFTADGWTAVGADGLQRKWTQALEQNVQGETRVYISGYNTAPRIIARAIVRPGGGSSPAVEKWVEVRLRKTSRFSNGLVAKDAIRFNGNNASMDSWVSDHDNNPATAPIPYSASVKRDSGSVGSISVSVNAVLIQNADIWGYASTGGALPVVGSNGRVGPFGTAAGTVDMSRVSTDFAANFDPVDAPSGGTTIASITNDDLPKIVGTFGTKSTIRLNSISASGNNTKVLYIFGDTTLVLTAPPGTPAIDLTGNSSIYVAPGAKLTIFTEGDVNIAGGGVANGGTSAGTANPAANFQIWGTRTSGTQNISVRGNGVLSGLVYAPNGHLSINGNTDVFGSFIADDISITGNAALHYDESLANMGDPLAGSSTGSTPFRVSVWNELTLRSERDAVLSFLEF